MVLRTRTPTIRSLLFQKNAPSRFPQTQNADVWRTFTLRCARFVRAKPVTNGFETFRSYNQVALIPKERTIKIPSDAKRRRLENLYAQVRKIRESKTGYERLGEIWEKQQAEHPEVLLLSRVIFYIFDTAC